MLPGKTGTDFKKSTINRKGSDHEVSSFIYLGLSIKKIVAWKESIEDYA